MTLLLAACDLRVPPMGPPPAEMTSTFIGGPGQEAGFTPLYEKYHYKTLTDAQKSAYLAVYDAAQAMETGDVFLGSDLTAADIQAAVEAYYADSPEHFWVSDEAESCWIVMGGLRYWWDRFFPAKGEPSGSSDPTTRGKGYCRMTYLFDSEAEVTAARAELDRALGEAFGLISPEQDDYSRQLLLHDWLTERCTYDRDAYKAIIETESVLGYEYAHTVYGALVKRKAVCSGYARAMQLLLGEAGIPCTYLTGQGNDREGDELIGHAWNVVTIGGSRYHMDATWDDNDRWGIADGTLQPLTGGEDAGEFTAVFHLTSHTYFNVTDEQLGLDHFNYESPGCTATEANYFNRTGPNVTNVGPTTEEMLTDALVRMSETEERLLEIRIGDAADPKELYAALCNRENGIIFRCLSKANEQLGAPLFNDRVIVPRRDIHTEIVTVGVFYDDTDTIE